MTHFPAPNWEEDKKKNPSKLNNPKRNSGGFLYLYKKQQN